ncbi:hypothetical protein [Microcystis aeruginosa]
MSVGALIEFYFKLIICITIPEEPKILVILNAMVRQNQPWQLADNLPPCS